MTAQVIRLSGTRLRLGLAAAAAWLAVSGVFATNFGPYTSGAAFTNTATGLASNTIYYWNHMASNTSGKAWAVLVLPFLAACLCCCAVAWMMVSGLSGLKVHGG